MLPSRVWIVEVRFTDRVRHKLETKHGVTPSQVEEATLFYGYRSCRWDDDRERGLRLIVRGEDLSGNRLVVYLRIVDLSEGVFECATARRMG